MSKVFHCKVELPDAHELLKKCNLQTGGAVQNQIDMRVIQYSIPYCPHDTGFLENSPFSVSTPGRVIYEGPYARYLYYGKVYGPNIPIYEDDSGVPTAYRSPPKKYPTGKDLQYKTDQNENAGPFWVERMKADHVKDIVEEVQAFVNDHINK
jgi:hypothetical protein